MKAKYTPMIRQYLRIKADYKDAFLFFRLGDFYEMFMDDAVKAAQELEITLTSRDAGAKERIPMCGVPYHSASTYIEQLINKGYKVAICEQTEDPKQAKGVVKREVVQLITPGTVMEGKGLAEKENNYIASVSAFADHTYGLVYSDLSTGETRATLLTNDFDSLFNELSILNVKEIVIDTTFDQQIQKILQKRLQVIISFENETEIKTDFSPLLADIKDEELRITAARLLHYLYRTQKRNLDHLQAVKRYEVNQYMKMDYYSKRNLELTESIREKSKRGTLLWLLDETMTAMGGRLLKQWIDRPLIHANAIKERQAIVEAFLQRYFERQDIRESLKGVYDLERLAGRVAYGNVNARDLIQLKNSLQQIPSIRELVEKLGNEKADKLAKRLDPCEELTHLLERAIVESPPISIKEGGIIKDGFDDTLDRYRDASRNGKSWLAQLEQKEREKTGIKSLKVGYNRVFGYYIEITKANLHLLKDDRYERKQTLANAERYITPELKEKEALILDADEKSIELEYDIFIRLRDYVKTFIPRLQQLAKIVSELDVLQCFATVSETNHYVKPTLTDDQMLYIQEGRHPVVEKVMASQEYVPNDCLMDHQRNILLITGPNMSGKSTYMRQVALIAILAQIGCYVPAKKATLPIFDQVFTRIGAADDLISGQSTFMVEMLEAKNAIANATKNSLILFDEIGRGTSTYDGMALAQAIIEYIHHHIGAKTLFSTHYHELTVLEEELDHLKNIHVQTIEQNGKVVFLHKMKDGAADKSYGIHVAELAELPKELIDRAHEILATLEKKQETEEQMSDKETNVTTSPNDKNDMPQQETGKQLSFFAEPLQPKKTNLSSKEKKVIDRLSKYNILKMTPLDAMNALYELQRKLKG